jgi:uncharacterized protein YndB with AHSA1/START domain
MAVSNARNSDATKAVAQELVITRVFDAPREIVWKAFTDPEHLVRWWGPKNYTSPACKIDLRVGGKYLFCMRSPEGQEYWSTGVYREIVPPERIVCTDSFADQDGNVVPPSHYGFNDDFPRELVMTVIFEEQDGKTKMTLRHAGMPAGDMSEMAGAGWNESFDKLAESLKQGEAPSAKTSFTIKREELKVVMRRVFDAPRDLVWKAFTDPNSIPRWWGPRTLTTTVERMEVRPGGAWRFIQRDPEGAEYAFNGVFKQIEPPGLLSYTFNFEGIPGEHEVFETVTFEDLNGKTKVTSTATFANIEDLDAMVASGMEAGAVESWDRLAEIVE